MHQHRAQIRFTTVRRAALIIAGAASLLALAKTYAFEPVGPDAELFATGTASFTYTDNVFAVSQHTTSDTLWDFTPGVLLEFGKNSLVKGSANAGVDFSIYDGHSSLNTELLTGGLNVGYSDGKTSVNGNINYQESDQPTATVRTTSGRLINRETFAIGGSAEQQTTDKTSIGGGVSYSDTHYVTAGFANLQSVTVPVNYYYKIDPKVDVSGGFAYSDQTVGRSTAGKGIDSDQYFYNVGVRGELTPLLTGQIRVGYTENVPSHGGDTSTLGVEGAFSYAYDPKTNLQLAVHNDYSYNDYGSEFRSAGFSVGATTALDAQWSLNGALAYSHYTYLTTSEADDYYSLSIGASYALNANVSLNAAYVYGDDVSNISIDSYKTNIFTVSASAKY